MRIHVLNGPNLNLLGQRDPAVYGSATLADIEASVRRKAAGSHEVTFAQTNGEGELVTLVQRARLESDGLILNGGAYTHTSVALHDALEVLSIPKIEVHLSNPAAREPFRHASFVARVVDGTIAGLGPLGYLLALDAVVAIAGAGARRALPGSEMGKA